MYMVNVFALQNFKYKNTEKEEQQQQQQKNEQVAIESRIYDLIVESVFHWLQIQSSTCSMKNVRENCAAI